VGSIPGANGDVFVFPPGVTANDRIDDFSAVANGTNPGGEDQFLVALISGSSYEDTIDGYDTGLDFHSSIYLLVDDHTGAPSEGFTIPAGAPKSVTSTAAAGAVLTSDATANYFRIALTDIERTRVITIDGTEVLNETANFKRQTRPIRAPRVVITGAADTSSGEAQIIEGVEVVFIEFTVYEPPDPGCNDAFVDASGQLVADVGSTYILRFRLTSDNTSGFNLTTGSTGTSTTFGGFSDNGLTLQDVEQLGTDNGGTGNSGPVSSLTSGNAPCAPGTGGGAPLDNSAFAVPIRSATISGFSPVE
jgi:hypothetical protein